MAWRRKWFQHEDGRYYRNIPLNMADREEKWWTPLFPARTRALEAEFQVLWDEGLIYADTIGPKDRVVHAEPFEVTIARIKQRQILGDAF